MDNNVEQPRISIYRLTEVGWGYIVGYVGPVEDFIAADIVPTEFFNFGLTPQGKPKKTRSVCQYYAQNKLGALLPEKIDRINGRWRKNGLFEFEVWAHRHPCVPFYVPEGDTWPGESDPRYSTIDRKFRCELPRPAEIIDFAKFRKPVRAIPPQGDFMQALAAECAHRFGLGVDEVAKRVSETLGVSNA